MPALDLGIIVPAIAVIVWLVRLEGRVNTGERRFDDLKESVEYIRDRIDEVLNKR